jgi:hypothetical protein
MQRETVEELHVAIISDGEGRWVVRRSLTVYLLSSDNSVARLPAGGCR